MRFSPRGTAVFVLAALNAFVLLAGVGVVALVPPAPVPPHVASRPVVKSPPVLRHVSASRPSAGKEAVSLRDPDLGRVSAVVVDIETGRPVFGMRSDARSVPASLTKIATGVAALSSIGPASRFTTKVVRPRNGKDIVLVGGGDPTLAGRSTRTEYPRPATLAELAGRTARSLKRDGVARVRLFYDDTLFTGPAVESTWKSTYVSNGNVAPVSALVADQGRVDPDGVARHTDPARAAAETFADMLRSNGIEVRNDPPEQRRAQKPAKVLAAVNSPPVSAIVERMLTDSDNDLAESLGRHVALAKGQPASFAGAGAAMRTELRRLRVARGISLVDASGLSPANRMTADAIVRLLELAGTPKHPELRSVLTGLPVAGFSGSLADRFSAGRAKAGGGIVRAKTGTLAGVSCLAGVAYNGTGDPLAFAFLANGIPLEGTLAAEDALDRLAATLVR